MHLGGLAQQRKRFPRRLAGLTVGVGGHGARPVRPRRRVVPGEMMDVPRLEQDRRVVRLERQRLPDRGSCRHGVILADREGGGEVPEERVLGDGQCSFGHF